MTLRGSFLTPYFLCAAIPVLTIGADAAASCEWEVRGEKIRLVEGVGCSFTGGPSEPCSYLSWSKGSEERSSFIYFRSGVSDDQYCVVYHKYEWAGSPPISARKILSSPDGTLQAFITCNGKSELLFRDFETGRNRTCPLPNPGAK